MFERVSIYIKLLSIKWQIFSGTGWTITKQDSSDADLHAGVWGGGHQACQDVCHHHLSLHHLLGTTLPCHIDQHQPGLERCKKFCVTWGNNWDE